MTTEPSIQDALAHDATTMCRIHSHRLDRDHTLKLRRDLQYLRINGPIAQLKDRALKQWGQTSTARIDIPIVASIVGIRPCNSDQTNKMPDWIFLGMLI